MKRFFSKMKIAGITVSSIAVMLRKSCGMILKKNLHGEKILKLSDDQLFEAIYFFTLISLIPFRMKLQPYHKLAPSAALSTY